MSTGEPVAQRIHNLIRQKYAVMESVPRALLVSSEIEASDSLSMVADSLMLRLTAYILEEQVESNYLEYPADWWEAFKDRWFPSWARARWPVHRMRWRGDIKAVYPDLIPDQRVILTTRFSSESDA